MDLSEEQKEFLAALEEEFSNRFTVHDEVYWEEHTSPLPDPPIIEPWYNKPRRRFDFGSRGRDNERNGRGRFDKFSRDRSFGSDSGHSRDRSFGSDSGHSRDRSFGSDSGHSRDRSFGGDSSFSRDGSFNRDRSFNRDSNRDRNDRNRNSRGDGSNRGSWDSRDKWDSNGGNTGYGRREAGHERSGHHRDGHDRSRDRDYRHQRQGERHSDSPSYQQHR